MAIRITIMAIFIVAAIVTATTKPAEDTVNTVDEHNTVNAAIKDIDSSLGFIDNMAATKNFDASDLLYDYSRRAEDDSNNAMLDKKEEESLKNVLDAYRVIVVAQIKARNVEWEARKKMLTTMQEFAKKIQTFISMWNKKNADNKIEVNINGAVEVLKMASVENEKAKALDAGTVTKMKKMLQFFIMAEKANLKVKAKERKEMQIQQNEMGKFRGWMNVLGKVMTKMQKQLDGKNSAHAQV